MIVFTFFLVAELECGCSTDTFFYLSVHGSIYYYFPVLEFYEGIQSGLKDEQEKSVLYQHSLLFNLNACNPTINLCSI
jgi:hypothetical protein